MHYVVDDPAGYRAYGVKDLSVREVMSLRVMGFTLHRYQGDNRLSLAASAIWRMRTAEPDPMDKYADDCGPLIEAHRREQELKAVAAYYPTPGAYNAALEERLGKSYLASMVLSIEDVCACGAALDKSVRYTRQYGGGWDSFYRCPSCGFSEVYV
jgi:hypothetical protein